MNDPAQNSLPLAGRRVLVTRTAHQAGKLTEGLRALGAEPVEVPVLEIRPPASYDALDHALRSLDSYDWLILTSANTVRALVDRAAHLKISLQNSAPLQVAAVGEATAQAARQAGFSIALVPESYVAESLIAELLHTPNKESAEALKGHGFSRANQLENETGALAPEASFSGQRILLARAAVARDVIPDALRAAGATVDVVDAYRNVMPESAPALLAEALRKGIDAVAFSSSSSATHLAEAARAAGLVFPFSGVAAVSIGPITSETLRTFSWEPAAEASPSDVPGLVQAVLRALAKLRYLR